MNNTLDDTTQNSTEPANATQSFPRINMKYILYWGLLFITAFGIFSLWSDGDFSFFLTLSAIIQMFGFLIISVHAELSQSVTGLSLNTIICYALSLFARQCSIIKHEGYLPYDSSGDFIYRAFNFFTFILALYMIFMIKMKYKSSYDRDLDTVSPTLLIGPTFIFALLIHPGLNNSYFADISWAFSLYLECLAMLPQLSMFSKKEGEIEVSTSHFMASQGFSRCLALIFWTFSYYELNEYSGTIWSLFKGYSGYFVMLFQILQVILFSNFLYKYVKSILAGLPIRMGDEVNYTYEDVVEIYGDPSEKKESPETSDDTYERL